MADKLKIAFFTSGFFPVNRDSVKATEYFVYHLAAKMAKLGHEVHIFGAEGSGGDNITIHLPKANRLRVELMEKESNYQAYILDDFCNCLDFCNKNGINLIHDHTALPLIWTVSRYSNIPIISTFHGVRYSPDLSPYIRSNLNIYNIAPSRYLADKSMDYNFFKVIYHGIDLTEFQFSPIKEGKGLISIGRIYEHKGQLDAVEAAELAGEKLTIAGYPIDNNKSEDYFQKLLQKIDHSKYCNFAGKIPRAKVPNFMLGAKGFLMPIQEGEAFGLVVVEALAMGVPVIAYNVGPMSEIIEDGVNGFLVPPNSPKKMAEAIANLHRIERKDCRKSAENKFDFDEMVKQYLDSYYIIIGLN